MDFFFRLFVQISKTIKLYLYYCTYYYCYHRIKLIDVLSAIAKTYFVIVLLIFPSIYLYIVSIVTLLLNYRRRWWPNIYRKICIFCNDSDRCNTETNRGHKLQTEMDSFLMKNEMMHQIRIVLQCWESTQKKKRSKFICFVDAL